MKTDTQLQIDVLDELKWHPSVDASQIGVIATNGVITLTGSVPQYAEKMEAERIATTVIGVTTVVNDLEVRLVGSSERNDIEIANAATYALRWHTWVPNDRIKVTVRNGWITLEGSVDWQYERAAAREAVSHLVGVKGFTNLIGLTTKPQPADIASKIETAFRRSAEIDARHVQVETRDNTVILTGRVTSPSERAEAERVAWAAPGVTNVDNRLGVSK
jgi:osmotically-inducible protein OsmY